jgi:hypothetical protein
MGCNQSVTSPAKFIGHCDSEYAEVREKFELMFKNKVDKNSQLCIWVGGKCVVDLCGKTVESYN